MDIVEELFNKYARLRLSGNKIEAVYEMMQAEVAEKLDKAQRSLLSGKCEDWEHTPAEQRLSPEQHAAMHNVSMTNVTIKILFCPVCDAPNVDGFTHCQVCDAPLAVDAAPTQTVETETVQVDVLPESDEGQLQASEPLRSREDSAYYDDDGRLVLKSLRDNERLVLYPQSSERGLSIGRKSGRSRPDVDLNAIGAANKGVSRIHARIRYDTVRHCLVIKDDGSTNGTYINSAKIIPHVENTLHDGDELKFGRLALKVRIRH